MGKVQQKEIRVFYSWQSDLPDKTNKVAIRKALQKSKKNFSEKIVLDEATREMPGSGSIPDSIREKIEASDIFVADITTVIATEAGRKSPNPNVVFELGYAVAHLGWSRVVMMTNLAFAKVQDAPFDFDRHRISTYTLAEDAKSNNQDKLNALVKSALKAIVVQNPKRPAEVKGLSEAQIKHTRDVENLTWLLDTIHLPTIDSHLESIPYRIDYKVLIFWEDFRGVVESSLFRLYDEDLKRAVMQFYKGWKKTVSHGECYHETSNPSVYVFSNPMDGPLSSKQEEHWEEIEKGGRAMAAAKRKILRIVEKRYLEIDIKKTNRTAWDAYKKFVKDEDADEL